MTTITATFPRAGFRLSAARLRAWAAEREQRRIDRAAFRTLLGLDDQMLRDIGVTRDEVRRAANLPLSVNAAQELDAVKRARRGW